MLTKTTIKVDDVLNNRLMIIGRGTHSIAYVNSDFTEVAIRTFEEKGFIDVSKEILMVAAMSDTTGRIPKIHRIYRDEDSIIYVMPYYWGTFEKTTYIYKKRICDLHEIQDKILSVLGKDCLSAMMLIRDTAISLGLENFTIVDLRKDNVRTGLMLADPIECLVPMKMVRRIIRRVNVKVGGSNGTSWKDRVSSLLFGRFRLQ